MKKSIALLALSMLLVSCAKNDNVSVTAEQLQHHRFVLESVNGVPLKPTADLPEISFAENMYVSGRMCNRFSGQGKLTQDELKVKPLAMTRMMCSDPQLNTLDHTISLILSQGVQVDLTANQLTLTTAEQTLIYRLADLMN